VRQVKHAKRPGRPVVGGGRVGLVGFAARLVADGADQRATLGLPDALLDHLAGDRLGGGWIAGEGVHVDSLVWLCAEALDVAAEATPPRWSWCGLVA